MEKKEASMKTVCAWLPAIVWMAVIFVLSSRQSISVNEKFIVNFLFFKTLHVLEYAMLFILYRRAFKNARMAFLMAIAYAITDEIHQTFVPTREGKASDVIIDAIGATFAWIFLVKLLPRLPKNLKQWGRRLELS